MKPYLFAAALIVASLISQAQASPAPTYLNLQSSFDTDIFLQEGGAGLTDPLDPERDRISAASLPASYQDGTSVQTQDGRASFLFGPLKQPALDAMTVNGQVLDVPDLRYGSVDLALLAAPGSYASPFSVLQFRYTDGTQQEQRLGPVPGWFTSPTAFDNIWFNYTDSSAVTSLVSFRTDFGDDEAAYLYDSRGNGNSGGNRFIDGTGYALYVLPLPTDLAAATLGVTVGNNFVISLATEYYDPAESASDYTEVANSMTLHDGFEHRALGNLKQYEFDLGPYLARKTGELYLLLTDATPSNGWGPYLQNINIFTGQNLVFEQTLQPRLNTGNATVYAEFLTNGEEAERPYLYDNSGSGPSNRRHRFADGNGSITYRFDLPDTVTDAKLTVDMANNFVVSIAGATSLERYAHVAPGTAEEKDFLIDDGNSNLGGNFRFADGNAYMVYQFDLPNDITTAIAQISVGNQFVVSLAAGAEGEFEVVKDWVAETGDELRDNSNLAVYDFPLDPFLLNNPENIIRIRLSDGQPADGWGPYLTGITIVNQTQTDDQGFDEVLNSSDLFGEDIHNEFNKAFYTIDLSSVLATANPKKEVFVKFTDQSPGDGWGPGIFWMAVYSGTLDIASDRVVFNELKALNGEPRFNGVSLIHRRYEIDATRTLKDIVLPAASNLQANKAYLLAATLNPAAEGDPANLRLRVEGSALRLSWTDGGLVLQSASAVNGPWTADSTPSEVAGGERVATIAPTEAARFYRLGNQ